MGVAGPEALDEADTVHSLVPELRRRGVEAIVVLLQQSGFRNVGVSASDTTGCLGARKNAASRNIDARKIVARRCNAVDRVICGCTHPVHNCSTMVVDVGAVGGAATAKTRSPGPLNAALNARATAAVHR